MTKDQRIAELEAEVVRLRAANDRLVDALAQAYRPAPVIPAPNLPFRPAPIWNPPTNLPYITHSPSMPFTVYSSAV